MKEATVIPITSERIEGTITKVIDDEEKGGYGFISSPKAKPYTRIFFHWTGLLNTTLNFKDIRKGMKCTFECINFTGKDGINKGWRAIKIEVLD